LIILHPDDKKKVTDFRKAPAKIETSRIRFDKNRRGQRDVFVPVKMLGAISRFEQIDEH
jgi:hypothetical protein